MGPVALVVMAPAIGALVHYGACRMPAASPSPGLGMLAAVQVASLGVAVAACRLMPPELAAITCGLGWVLLLLAVIDIRRMVLPDLLTLPLAVAGLAAAQLPAGADYGRSVFDHLIGAFAGYGAFAAVAWSYRRLRGRHGLGGGDAKLLAAAGAWVCWQGLAFVVLIASLGGLAWFSAAALWRGDWDPDRPMPFGPFLCCGLWLTWLAGSAHVV